MAIGLQSNAPISNKKCNNKECIEIRLKYNKLKQAYTRSLTANIANTEKILKYESEAKEREGYTQKVSLLYL